jgi:hypothetical protein
MEGWGNINRDMGLEVEGGKGKKISSTKNFSDKKRPLRTHYIIFATTLFDTD